MNSSLKLVFGCVAALIMASIAATGACLFFVGQETPQLAAALDLPHEAAVGETIQLVIHASNPHQESVTLDSVDIDDALLEGLQVLEVEPTPTGTIALGFLEQRSWTFDHSIPSTGQLEVVFTMRAIQPGRYTGNVDVCNPRQDFTSLYGDIVITGDETDVAPKHVPEAETGDSGLAADPLTGTDESPGPADKPNP